MYIYGSKEEGGLKVREFVEFEVFEEEEVRRGIRQAPKGEGSSFSGGLRGFVNISSVTRNLEMKYRDSRRG
jgi:hypothetical protein